MEIWHNPRCRTDRQALVLIEAIEDARIEPDVHHHLVEDLL
ncbi:MAG TPA: hypothetical protein VGA36_09210 [Nitriliruptorales bacterium]